MGISASNIRTTPPSTLAMMDEGSDAKVQGTNKLPPTETPNLDAIPKGAFNENDADDKGLPPPKPFNSDALQSTHKAVSSLHTTAGADIFAVMALFQRITQDMASAARQGRHTAAQSQQKSLLSAAEEEKKGIPLRKWGGIVQGILQAGGGLVSLGGAIKSGVGASRTMKASPAPTKPNTPGLGDKALAAKTPDMPSVGTMDPQAKLAGNPIQKSPSASDLSSDPGPGPGQKALGAKKDRTTSNSAGTQESVSPSAVSQGKSRSNPEVEMAPLGNKTAPGAAETKKQVEAAKPDGHTAAEVNEPNSQPAVSKEKTLQERKIEAAEKKNALKEQELSAKENDDFNAERDRWNTDLSRKLDSYRNITAGAEAFNQIASGAGAAGRALNEGEAAEHDAAKAFQNAAAQKHEMDYQQYNDALSRANENSRYVLDKLDASVRAELETQKSIARNMA